MIANNYSGVTDMRKINEEGAAAATDLRLTNIRIKKAEIRPEMQLEKAEKELDMMAWGFKKAVNNLPPITTPDKKVKRRAPGAGERVYEKAEVPVSSWGSMLKDKLNEIKEDILYLHDIAESKREMRRDMRELKRMEKTDKHDMAKLRMVSFLTGGAIS